MPIPDCPFCGCPGAVQASLYPARRASAMQCETCGAQGPSVPHHNRTDEEIDTEVARLWSEQWALQYTPSCASAAASGGGFDPHNP